MGVGVVLVWALSHAPLEAVQKIDQKSAHRMRMFLLDLGGRWSPLKEGDWWRNSGERMVVVTEGFGRQRRRKKSFCTKLYPNTGTVKSDQRNVGGHSDSHVVGPPPMGCAGARPTTVQVAPTESSPPSTSCPPVATASVPKPPSPP